MAAGKQNLAEEDGGDPLKNRFGAPNLKVFTKFIWVFLGIHFVEWNVDYN